MSQPIFGMIAGIEKKSIDRARGLGVKYVDLHFNKREDLLEEAIEYCQAAGLKYVLNVEGTSLDWVPSPGLRKRLEKNSYFMGFILDECDHMQLNAHWPVVKYYGYNERHFFAETDDMDVFEAQKAVAEGIKKRRDQLDIDGKDVAGEYLFPVMMHIAAASGVSASPKVLKETFGPAMIAVGLGASLQYGGVFGIDVDAWWHPETVGHSVERFRSALKMAYWSGADRIYAEGGYGLCGHPLEEEIPSCYKEFINGYVPEHPRSYSWRDYKPSIAIIRFDDTCFDDRQKYADEYPGPLFGHIAAEKVNTEWLNIWNLLSHGHIRTDSVSHQWESGSVAARTLFAPLNSVAVFDHKVGYDVLKGICLIFLTGAAISPDTLEAVERLVREGAVCVLPPRFLPSSLKNSYTGSIQVINDGIGKWLVVPEFYSLHYETWHSGPVNPIIRETLEGLIGDGEQLIYDFDDCRAVLTPKKDKYAITRYYNCREIPRVSQGNPDDIEAEIIAKGL